MTETPAFAAKCPLNESIEIIKLKFEISLICSLRLRRFEQLYTFEKAFSHRLNLDVCFFFDLLSEEVKCRKFSLAGALKETLRNKILKEYNIDVYNCSAKEKEVIRPVLVEYGTKKRAESEGRFWIEKLNQIISIIAIYSGFFIYNHNI